MSQVKVAAHPDTGNVITPSSNNPKFGTIRVDSEHKSFEGGFVNISKRSAFIRGKMSDLNSLGLRKGQALQGKIIKKESFEPFYEGHASKINPQTGEAILTNGRETYLQYEYTADKNACDTWVGETPAEVSSNVQEAFANQAV